MEDLSDELINVTLSSGDDVDVYQLPVSLRWKGGDLLYETPMGMSNKDLTPSFPIELENDAPDSSINDTKQLPSSSAFSIHEEVKQGESTS